MAFEIESDDSRIPPKYQVLVMRRTMVYLLAFCGVIFPIGASILTGVISYQSASQAAVFQVDSKLQQFQTDSARQYVTKDELKPLVTTVQGIDEKTNQILGFLRAKFPAR